MTDKDAGGDPAPVLGWSLDFFLVGEMTVEHLCTRSVFSYALFAAIFFSKKEKSDHRPVAGHVHGLASCFIGFGELPGSSAEGFPL